MGNILGIAVSRPAKFAFIMLEKVSAFDFVCIIVEYNMAIAVTTAVFDNIDDDGGFCRHTHVK